MKTIIELLKFEIEHSLSFQGRDTPVVIHVDFAEKILNALESGSWIPATERLPDESHFGKTIEIAWYERNQWNYDVFPVFDKDVFDEDVFDELKMFSNHWREIEPPQREER